MRDCENSGINDLVALWEHQRGRELPKMLALLGVSSLINGCHVSGRGPAGSDMEMPTPLLSPQLQGGSFNEEEYPMKATCHGPT